MKVQLEAGDAKLRIWFDPAEQLRRGQKPKKVRATHAILTLQEIREFETEAKCSKKDHFSRKVGRQIVAEHMLAILRAEGFSKSDRATVFNAICPDLAVLSIEQVKRELAKRGVAIQQAEGAETVHENALSVPNGQAEKADTGNG